MTDSDDGGRRRTHEAESRRVRAIEGAVAARIPRTPIDFEGARERELERVHHGLTCLGLGTRGLRSRQGHRAPTLLG